MNYQFSYHLLFKSLSIFKRIYFSFIAVIVCFFVTIQFTVAQQINTKKINLSDSVAIKINKNDTIGRLSDSLILTTSNTNNKNSNLNNDSLKIDSFSYLPRNSSAIKSIVKYTAKDSIAFVDSVRMLDLYGDAKVFYEDLNNRSEHITIDLNRNTISSLGKIDSLGTLIGAPEFKQGANDYKAVKITYNYVTKKGYLKEFKTKEGEGFVKGANVKRDPENNFYIDGAYYTTCDAEHPHFYIGSRKIKVIPGKKLITGPANFVIEGIQTPLFLPFGIFPLKRGQQSGVIIPQYGIDAQRGPNLRGGGYYFGLGERFDLTLTGDIFTNFSWLLNVKSNYRTRYRYNGLVNVMFGNNKFGNPDDASYNEQSTYSIGWNHAMDFKARPFTTFSASVNFVSSNFYSQNAQRSATQFNSTSNSSISFSRGFKNGKYNLSTTARVDQNLQTRTISATLPNIAFTVAAFNPFKPKNKVTAEYWYEQINMSYSTSFNNSFTTTDTTLFRSRESGAWTKFIDTTFRYGITHNLPINTSFKLFKFYVLSVNANYNETWAPTTIRKEFINNEVKTRLVSEFGRWFTFSTGASLSTKWYGILAFKKGKIAAIRHVADPNLGFSYTPDFSEKMWGFYQEVKMDSTGKMQKYSIFESSYGGAPGQGKLGNITFGLNNNLELKLRTGKDTAMKETKVKLLESFSFSGAYNIFADSLNLSTISINGRTTLFKTLAVNAYATLDPYQNIIVKQGATERLQRVNQYYFENNGNFGKITNANLNFGYSLSQATFEGKKKRKEERKKENDKWGYNNYELPWSLSLNYAIQYQANSFTDLSKTAYVQTLGFSGNVTVTKGWSFGYSSGYDFVNKKIASLFIDLKRDLHCWQFTFSWSPIAPGGFSFFNFQINPKSSVLQELKLPKRKDYFDNRNY
ncbi:MAG: putative LPS assembly protein LptD [Candidatus Methylacidiphilales bacterium]